jgi:indole-3-glycerol phosphate synthase
MRDHASRAGHSMGEEDVMNTRMTAELHTALGSAFSATLLGVAVRDLERFAVLGDRLLEELRKRGVAVYQQADTAAVGDPGS